MLGDVRRRIQWRDIGGTTGIGVRLASKLPDVGTTIFTVMSKMASDYGAINLSQGYPDFDGPPELIERVCHHMQSGHNQYPPMTGVPELRGAIAGKVRDLYGLESSPETDITVTSGATEALLCAISAVIHSGDEAIVLDPAYDSYEPAVKLAGGSAVHVPLRSRSFLVDWQRVEDAVTTRTKLIVINSPHNPSGAVLDAGDMASLRSIVLRYGLYVVSDEVYEHMIFDGRRHESVLRYPDLAERAFVISSFGKTYHVTGWKVAYVVAPPELTEELRKIHQFVTFTTNTPVQLGIADFLSAHPEHHLDLAAFYQRKRDLFCGLLQSSRFAFEPSAGTYFQCVDYGAITEEPDTALVTRLTRDHGVAAIPVSVFYQVPPEQNVIRFCFCKDDETLERAASKLCRL